MHVTNPIDDGSISPVFFIGGVRGFERAICCADDTLLQEYLSNLFIEQATYAVPSNNLV